jgi:hypothetical protein
MSKRISSNSTPAELLLVLALILLLARLLLLLSLSQQLHQRLSCVI